MPKLLIIEDSRVQALQLEKELKRQAYGFDVSIARDGEEGLIMARSLRPDLIVLDLGLPRKSGMDVLRELRSGEETREIPVIVATADETIDRQLIGFALGADDYVVKPLNVKVLVARIETILRRRRSRQGTEQHSVIERHGVSLDRYRHLAMKGSEELALTPTEFRLLDVLLVRPGRVFSRSELMDALVGDDGAILEGSINVYVRNLRVKLGDQGALIETVRGVGYRFREAPKHGGDEIDPR